MASLPEAPGSVVTASLWGMSAPWTLLLSLALGAWTMASPDVLGVRGGAADVLHLGGAVGLVVAVVAMAEPLRVLRYLNVGVGLAVAALPWILGGAGAAGGIDAVVAGLLLAVLALPCGPVREHYGGWDRWIR